MLNKMTVVLLVLCAASCLGADKKSSVRQYGEISGVVLTEEGVPAVDFEVCTQLHTKQSSMEQTLTCCRARTNSEGRFTIKDIKAGKYELVATNYAEGYSIENQAAGQFVTIEEKNLRSTVTLHLRNRYPVVVAHISDKNTEKPLDHALLSYEGVDCEAGGSVLVGVQGQYSLPIPTDCDVTLIARAKGYKGWVYTEPQSPSRPVLRLAVGQRKVLNIELEPSGN